MSLTLESKINDASLMKIKELEKATPPTLMILESPLVGLNISVAEHVAKFWVDSEYYDHDVKVLNASSDKWTVNEVQTLMIDPTEKFPYDHHVIIVNNADLMDLSASEKLLKTVEEPSSPTTFIFCVSEGTKLLKTLQGRANLTISLKPASLQKRLEALKELNKSEEDALKILNLAKDQVQLIPLLSENELLFSEAEKAFNLKTDKTVTASQDVFKSLSILANALQSNGSKVNDKLDAASRVILKVLMKDLFNRHRLNVQTIIKTTSNSETLNKGIIILNACDEAEKQLNLYTSPQVVLNSFFLKF